MRDVANAGQVRMGLDPEWDDVCALSNRARCRRSASIRLSPARTSMAPAPRPKQDQWTGAGTTVGAAAKLRVNSPLDQIEAFTKGL